MMDHPDIWAKACISSWIRECRRSHVPCRICRWSLFWALVRICTPPQPHMVEIRSLVLLGTPTCWDVWRSWVFSGRTLLLAFSSFPSKFSFWQYFLCRFLGEKWECDCKSRRILKAPVPFRVAVTTILESEQHRRSGVHWHVLFLVDPVIYGCLLYTSPSPRD